jgi:uncharacterized membrane protein YkoI
MTNVKPVYVTAVAIFMNLMVINAVHATSSKEADALSAAKISLVQAVDMLEKDGKGKTVGAEFDIEKDIAIWEVKILGASGVMEYKVNANTGAIVKIEDEHIQGKLMSFITGMNMQDLKSEKISLGEAVGTAEEQFSGKAVKVQIEHENNSIQYDIFVYTYAGTHKYKIDAMSGKVLKQH